jgi:folate-dependent phosphoribosylglycinamide formyltransferase PurN
MKIGLLTGRSLTEHELKVLDPILKDKLFEVNLVIGDFKKQKTFLQKIKKNIKRGRGGYMIVMLLKKLIDQRNHHLDILDYCKTNDLNMIKTLDLYSDKTLGIIKNNCLDVLVLIGGFGIIKEPIINICPGGVISYHHGNMRKYRGMPPGFWELYNGENEMGITIQKIADGLDCGNPIEEKSIHIYRTDTYKILRERANKESENMMYNALKKIANPEYKLENIDEFGQIYTLPNFQQWIYLNIKLFLRRFKA